MRNEIDKTRNSSLGREMQRIMGSGSFNKQATVGNLNQSTVSLAHNFNLFVFCFVKNKE